MSIKKLSISLSIAVLLGSSLSAGAATPIRLTNNAYEDANPRIYQEHVVWNAWDGNDWEIFYHNLNTGETRQITNNDSDDVMPDTDGVRIAWLPESGEMFPFVRIHDLALGLSYDFYSLVHTQIFMPTFMANGGGKLGGPRIRGEKLLFSVNGSVVATEFNGIDSGAYPLGFSLTLGQGIEEYDAYESINYKFLDDSHICWGDVGDTLADARYPLQYTIGGEPGVKTVVKEDQFESGWTNRMAELVIGQLPEYPGYDMITAMNEMTPPIAFNCSNMTNGGLSISKHLDGSDYDLSWSYNGQGNFAITADAENDAFVSLTGNRMAWVKGEGANAEIYVAEIADKDADQVPDYFDNCPTVANPMQMDTDMNGVGDACEGIQPTPSISANGSSEAVTIGSNETLVVTIDMDAKDYVGMSSDWFVTADTPTGHYSFTVDQGWILDDVVSYQGDLSNLTDYVVWTGTLPPGNYTFSFNVDFTPNGVNENIASAASINVTILP